MILRPPDRRISGCPCPLCDGPPHMIISFRGTIKALAIALAIAAVTLAGYCAALVLWSDIMVQPASPRTVRIGVTGVLFICAVCVATLVALTTLICRIGAPLYRLWHDNPTITLGKKPPPIPPAHTRSRK